MAANFIAFVICLLLHNVSAFKNCPLIDPPENGQLYDYRSYFLVFCNPGYSPTGNSHILCIDGQWEQEAPQCILNTTFTCPDLPDPENGIKHCQEAPLTAGKACWFRCLDGYTLSGVDSKLCMSDLHWSRGHTKCIPKLDGRSTCPEPSAPENGIKECEQGPFTVGKSCRFMCKYGFKSVGNKLSYCLNNLRWSGGSPKCIPETGKPCKVPPPLKNGRVINCSPKRIPVTGRSCFFTCNPGYLREGPSELYCDSNGKLMDIHGKESLPECKPKTGNRNQNRNEGNRDSTRGQPTSNRPTNRPSRPSVKPCSIENGGCQQLCHNSNDQAVCRCRKGYSLDKDGKHCIDIDECSSEVLNRCSHTCNNTEGGYTCSCPPGYVQINEYKCEGCRKTSYWSYDENACIDCPANSHTDSEAKTSIEDCVCNPGFIGDPKQNIPCEDIDECATGNFGCSHSCVNLPGSAYCSCNIGYTVDKDNKTCVDIDECSIKNGGCEGLCINTDGDFRCACTDGFTASNKDRYSCDDIDECLENNGGCEQKCINYPGGYYCSCESGFRLDSQLKNCTNIVCPRVPLPNYSLMTCKRNGNVLPELESYPIGTVCNFNCFKGYKNTAGSKNIRCLESGEWKGTVAHCRAQQCEPLRVPENGEIHPSSCSKHGNSVKQRCTFTCHQGYRLVGKPVYKCNNDLTWSIKEIPVCEPVKVQPFLSCPRDITEDLQPGENVLNITIPEPATNLEAYRITPVWVSTGKPIEFPAGITKVIFSGSNPNKNGTIRCTMNVHVVDKEPPVFDFCPDPIVIEGASGFGIPVSWEEPFVNDNVGVEHVLSSMERNTTLTPGTYFVEYIAKDKEGNTASCSFEINITRSHCSDLPDPAHGEANCMDWIFGKVCNPICDPGYMRNPSDPPLYSCDDSGLWDPMDVITDCLKYTIPVSSACPDGYELKVHNDTEEEVCMECPETAVWSSSSRTCEEE